MAIRIERIIATVLRSPHLWQAGEVYDLLAEGPEWSHG
jgi:hypothetical protein